jgi:hypothetical protein
MALPKTVQRKIFLAVLLESIFESAIFSLFTYVIIPFGLNGLNLLKTFHLHESGIHQSLVAVFSTMAFPEAFTTFLFNVN